MVAEDGGGGATVGEAASVDAVVVVVTQVAFEVSAQGGELWHEGAGEGASPAFLENGALDALHDTVGLRAAGVDEAVVDSEGRGSRTKGLRAELGAVVGGDRSL